MEDHGADCETQCSVVFLCLYFPFYPTFPISYYSLHLLVKSSVVIGGLANLRITSACISSKGLLWWCSRALLTKNGLQIGLTDLSIGLANILELLVTCDRLCATLGVLALASM